MKKALTSVLLVAVTLAVLLAPTAYSRYKNELRLSRESRIQYDEIEQSKMSAQELALLYSKGMIANNSTLLQAVNEPTPSEESVRAKVNRILENAFSTGILSSKLTLAASAPMEYYHKDHLLYARDNAIDSFAVTTVRFLNADTMLDITFEESCGIILSADYREFKVDRAAAQTALDALLKETDKYYCEALSLDIDRYFFAPLIYNSELMLQFGIKQGTMADIEKEYYN